MLERAGAKDVRLRLSSLGNADTRAAYGEELKTFLREHARPSCRTRCGRVSTPNPLRAFDADHPGTRTVMQEAPLLLGSPRRRRRRALRRGAGAARPGRLRVRARSDPGAWAGLLHAHGVRVRERQSWARRARWAVAGATTAWSSSSAGRRRRAWDGRPASSGSCWRADVAGAARREGLRRLDRRRPTTAFAMRRGRSRAGEGATPSWSRRAARSRASSSRRIGIGAAYVVLVGDGLEVKDMEHRRAARRGRRRRGRRGGDVRGDRHLRQPLPLRLVRRAAQGAGRQRDPRGRLGAPPPRPRRADLHRPARPRGAAPAGLPPGGERRGPRGRARAAPRARDLRAAARWSSARRAP